MNHLDTQVLIIACVIDACLLGIYLCKVVDVVGTRMQRIKRMQKSLDTMKEHAALMHESCQARSKN